MTAHVYWRLANMYSGSMPYINLTEMEMRSSVGGANLATIKVPTDSSANALVFTRNAGYSPSSAVNSGASSNSAKFSGSNAGLTLAANSLFDRGTGDWTIEGWVNPSGFANPWATLFGNRNGSYINGCRAIMVQGTSGSFPQKIALVANTGSAVTIINSTSTLSSGTGYWWSICKNGGTIYLHINGHKEAQVSDSNSYNWSSVGSAGVAIGSNGWDGGNGYLNGYQDRFRFTAAARYGSSDYTAPSGPLPVGSGSDSFWSNVVCLFQFDENPDPIFTASSGTVGNAFDGNTGTNWESSSGSSTYIACQFPSAVDIVEYTMRAGTFLGESPIQWDVQYSDNGSSWTTASTERSISWSSGETKTFRIYASSNAVPALFWRLNITATNYTANGYCAILECEMHTAIGGSQAATGGVASASSEQNTPCVRAFDGNTSTYWETQNDNPYWLRYKFPSAVNIVEYSIKNPTFGASEAPKTWTLEHSGDGVNWTVADTRTNETGWANGELRTYTLSSALARPVVFAAT